MNVVEELLAQRDAVLFGEWVKTTPSQLGHACLVERCVQEPVVQEPIWERLGVSRNNDGSFTQCLSDGARRFVNRVVEIKYRYAKAWHWNDLKAESKEEVIEVLDEAIRMAKEMADKEAPAQ